MQNSVEPSLKQDSYFRMGQAHKVCEDYALHGTAPFPWLVVCDGCSASTNTDVGARLLAWSAAKYLQHCQKPLDYHDVGQTVIEMASQRANLLGLTSSCLDATLLLAIQQDNTIRVLQYGDGHIVLKDTTGKVKLISTEFKGNAPYYLSYWLDSGNQQAYARSFPDPNTLSLQNDISGNTLSLSYDTCLEFVFELEKFPLVGVASDGLSSFIQIEQQALVSAQQVAEVFMGFKNFNEDFVQRRMNKGLISLAQQQIVPLDDVSMGVFYQPSDNQ